MYYTKFLFLPPIAIGFVLSPFAQIIPVIMITFGAVAGFGAGLMYLPANVAIGYYFERFRQVYYAKSNF